MKEEDLDPVEDTTVDEGSTEDTLQDDALEQEEASSEIPKDDSQEDTQPEEADDDSLTTSESEQDVEPNTEPKKEMDWEARYKGSQRSWQQEREQRAAAEKKLEEFEARLRAQEEEQAKREAESYEPWDERSPNHASFNATLQKYDMFKQALDKASDEAARQNIAEAFQPMFSADEMETIQRHSQHVSAMQRKLATPQGLQEHINSIVEERIKESFTSRQQEEAQAREYDQAREYYAKLYAEPDNAKLLSDPAKREEFQQRLVSFGDNPPRDAVEIVLENMRFKAGLGKSAEQIAEAKKEALSAREQKRLAKGRAKTERDQGTSTSPVDPVSEAIRIAKERGINPSSSKFNKLLLELSE